MTEKLTKIIKEYDTNDIGYHFMIYSFFKELSIIVELNPNLMDFIGPKIDNFKFENNNENILILKEILRHIKGINNE